jgi:23S rRNA pseudouridine1911/1915/1917 synthase
MQETKRITFRITLEDLEKFKRLDAFLAKKNTQFSRTTIKKLFTEGKITSTEKLELKKMPKLGTQIMIELPPLSETDIIAQNIPLDILYEDEFLLIINKPAGLVVHPAPGNPDGTLVNAVLYHCQDLKGIGHEKRPGIVHRLDKGTSGIMVIAKEQKTHEGLVSLFSRHDIDRKYQAICFGDKLPPQETLKSILGRNPHNRLKMTTHTKQGKNAITHMRVLEIFERFSHVELTLETGRTHQIRVHLSELLHSPILNDATYGRLKEEKQALPDQIKGLIKDYEHPFLHARRLGFIHPITKQNLCFEQGPPPLFTQVLEGFRKINESLK